MEFTKRFKSLSIVEQQLNDKEFPLLFNTVILEFQLEDGETLSPWKMKDYLKQAQQVISTSDFKNLIAISGRGPIWLFTSLAHLCHPARAVAVFDPRVGYIVISTHYPDFVNVGYILEETE